MGKEENLWNVTEHKTRKVMEHISNLKPRPAFSLGEKDRFEKVKNIALSKISAEEMLNVIGYNFGKENRIYSDVADKESKG